MKILVFTVTNDLNYDQRMIRICRSLATSGYTVLLVGRVMPGSEPIVSTNFTQKRLNCVFSTGKAFYLEFNLRLFLFLLFQRMDCICAIDLDTIVPCYLISRIKKIPRVYDAHELFCEMKEIVLRPRIYRLWKWIEKNMIPRFPSGYTVNQPIADEFHRMYGVRYKVIRNISLLEELVIPEKPQKCILYQGAVNEGRSFETLIPAMCQVNAPLIICGDGNFLKKAIDLVASYRLQEKILFKGRVQPDKLRSFTVNAWIGITLFDKDGLSNYFSLANRFFDFLHAGIPQVCINYPVYRDLNNKLPFAVLIDDLEPATIAKAINQLLVDKDLYNQLQQNALLVRQQLNWQKEEQLLISFYRDLKSQLG